MYNKQTALLLNIDTHYKLTQYDIICARQRHFRTIQKRILTTNSHINLFGANEINIKKELLRFWIKVCFHSFIVNKNCAF